MSATPEEPDQTPLTDESSDAETPRPDGVEIGWVGEEGSTFEPEEDPDPTEHS